MKLRKLLKSMSLEDAQATAARLAVALKDCKSDGWRKVFRQALKGGTEAQQRRRVGKYLPCESL